MRGVEWRREGQGVGRGRERSGEGREGSGGEWDWEGRGVEGGGEGRGVGSGACTLLVTKHYSNLYCEKFDWEIVSFGWLLQQLISVRHAHCS